MTQTPGPAVDLIEHAAGIIAAKMKEPHTGPYHWAGALWEAGMLQPPGHAGRLLPAEAADLLHRWDTDRYGFADGAAPVLDEIADRVAGREVQP